MLYKKLNVNYRTTVNPMRDLMIDPVCLDPVCMDPVCMDPNPIPAKSYVLSPYWYQWLQYIVTKNTTSLSIIAVGRVETAKFSKGTYVDTSNTI